MKSTVWPDSSAGPALIAVAQPVTRLRARRPRPPSGSAPLVNDGASLTAVTVIVKVCVALVSTPPLAVPPLSWIVTVTVAVPTAFAAGVKVSVPVGLTAGCGA